MKKRRKKNWAKFALIVLDTLWVESLEDIHGKIRALSYRELEKLLTLLSKRGLITEEWDGLTAKGAQVLMKGINMGLLK